VGGYPHDLKSGCKESFWVQMILNRLNPFKKVLLKI